MPPLTRARAAAEAPTLLDALARAPAAAALVVAALGLADRKALRLAHTQLRDAVAEVTTKLEAEFLAELGRRVADLDVAIVDARPPTARRWPRLEELTLTFARMDAADAAALEALGSEAWPALRTLRVMSVYPWAAVEGPALALAAALRRMPALRALELLGPAAAALAALARGAAAPQLRSLTVMAAVEPEDEEQELGPAALLALAASGWRLESLDLSGNRRIGAAGVAALVAAPAFSIRHLDLSDCKLDAASLLCVANAPWPLEELEFWDNDLSAAAAGPALAALSQHRGLRRLGVGSCKLSAAGFKALMEAAWPALTFLSAASAKPVLDGPRALGAAAFAGFPALEEMYLSGVALGEAGAHLLASRRWVRLRALGLADLGDAGLAALACGAWPALRVLGLSRNAFAVPPTLEGVRRWAPALEALHLQ